MKIVWQHTASNQDRHEIFVQCSSRFTSVYFEVQTGKLTAGHTNNRVIVRQWYRDSMDMREASSDILAVFRQQSPSLTRDSSAKIDVLTQQLSDVDTSTS